jgi:pimeloyl-ACP methyl ester carboxylesterase
MTPPNFDTTVAGAAPVAPPLTLAQGVPTVVSIHGFLDEGPSWAAVQRALASTGLSTIAPDLPGMEERAGEAGPFSLDRLADDVLDRVERLEGPLVLVGHSMGAQVAELLANACLDRVVALVLLTPVPLGGMALPPEVAFTLRGLGANPEAHRDVRAQLAGPLAQLVLEDLAAAGRKVREQVVAALFDAWSAGVSAGGAKTEVGCPILLIGSANDPFVTPELLESVIKPRFPGALTFVSGAGHWPHVERPDVTVDIVATFLATLRKPGA